MMVLNKHGGKTGENLKDKGKQVLYNPRHK